MIKLIPHEARPLLRNAAMASAFAGRTQKAVAATPDGQFAARGIGALTCKTITDTEGDKRVAAIATLPSLIAGYVTHANRAPSDWFDVTPIAHNTILASMRILRCADNPEALVEVVVATVLDSTAAGEQRSQSDLIQLRNDQSDVIIRAGAVRLEQPILADIELLTVGVVD